MDEPSRGIGAGAASAVAIGKDLVALLRDAALFFLGILLVAFPGRLNAMLVDAGFEEGSVVGFKWKSRLVASDESLQKAQATIAQLQSKNDELVAALGQAKAHSTDAALDKRIDTLASENRQLKDSTQQVQAAVSETIESNGPLVEKALASTGAPAKAAPVPADYTVGLQTLGASEDEKGALNAKLRADGYALDPLSYAYPSGERPSWFAARSTVFYYDSSALPMAQAVARLMKAATGQDYAVQKGAGLGVDPARRKTTIFVHYLKG